MNELFDTMQAINKVASAGIESGRAMAQLECLQRISALEKDCLTLCLRLMGENPDTFTPETREVMERWAPKVRELLDQPESQPSKAAA